MNYKDQLQHPNWQRRRLERMEASGWKCADCGAGDRQLHVHHERYIAGRMAWDYEDALLIVLCHGCHEKRHGRAPVRVNRISKSAMNLLDRAIWLLLHRCEAWAALDGESRDILAAQAAPYDMFFRCVERSLHEHGALAPAAMLDEMRQRAHEFDGDAAVLTRIAAFHDPEPEADLTAELALVIDKLRRHVVHDELRRLYESGVQSADTQARSRELYTAILLLKAAPK